MTPNLPESLEPLIRPLFKALPIEQAMQRLVVDDEGAGQELRDLVEQIIQEASIQQRPDLHAGLWLYVDELDRSHRISQQLQTPTGSFWHAIMHRREGDFPNSHHWYRRAGKHPVISRIDTGGGGAAAGTTIGDYDPHEFIDNVERAHRRGDNTSHELVTMQRREWRALFEWCAEH